MGIDFQLHRASVDISKGVRQFQKADKELYNDNIDSATKHYDKGLDKFASAMNHLANAEDDAYNKAGSEIDKGNNEMRKAIGEYNSGNLDRAQEHYNSALNQYDEALDLLG